MDDDGLVAFISLEKTTCCHAGTQHEENWHTLYASPRCDAVTCMALLTARSGEADAIVLGEQGGYATMLTITGDRAGVVADWSAHDGR